MSGQQLAPQRKSYADGYEYAATGLVEAFAAFSQPGRNTIGHAGDNEFGQ